MTTPWAHLPNAKYIDRILESIKVNEAQWKYDWRNITCGMPQEKYDEIWDDAWDDGMTHLEDQCRAEVWSELNQRLNGATVRSPIMGLVSYDECGYMIESDPGELSILAAFRNQQAILLLPAAIVFNEIKKLN